MKTLQHIKELYQSGEIPDKNLYRLADFIPIPELADFGINLSTSELSNHTLTNFTKEAILEILEEQVDWGFTKALMRKAMSSSGYADDVQFWNWVLEEGLEDYDYHIYYGLPIFKATAVKYGFDNRIGEDDGDEWIYDTYEED